MNWMAHDHCHNEGPATVPDLFDSTIFGGIVGGHVHDESRRFGFVQFQRPGETIASGHIDL